MVTALYNINGVVSILEKWSVFCEVATAFLNIIYTNFMLRWVEPRSADQKIPQFRKSDAVSSPSS
jgi:hypothetical protein